MRKKIVVLGAGIGGTSAAYELRETLGADAEITVVSDTPWFHFVPSNPWVAVMWRKPEDIKIHLPETFSKFGISFSAAGARRIRPAESAVDLGDGSTVEYDYLVIATGPELAFDEIEGLGPAPGFTQSVCHVDHAEVAADAFDAEADVVGCHAEVLQKGRVVGAGAKCLDADVFAGAVFGALGGSATDEQRGTQSLGYADAGEGVVDALGDISGERLQ